MGELQHEAFQFTFNGFLKVAFQGSRITSDAGLLLVRELDERLGLATLIAEHLSDSRQGLNTQFSRRRKNMRERHESCWAPMATAAKGVVVVMVLLSLSACGGDTSSPTSPTPPVPPSAPPPPAPVTVSTEHGTIFIGQQVQFQVTVSGGPSMPAAAAWSSDTPTVATVSPSGVMTAVAAGEATISADVPDAGRGAQRIRVYPEFEGRWVGLRTTTRAVVPEAWRQVDPDLMSCYSEQECGSSTPMVANFTQRTETVSGSVQTNFSSRENDTWNIVSGTVSIDGTLRLTFTDIVKSVPEAPLPPGTEIRFRLTSWEARADTPGVMTGTVRLDVSTDALAGTFMQDGCLGSACSGWSR